VNWLTCENNFMFFNAFLQGILCRHISDIDIDVDQAGSHRPKLQARLESPAILLPHFFLVSWFLLFLFTSSLPSLLSILSCYYSSTIFLPLHNSSVRSSVDAFGPVGSVRSCFLFSSLPLARGSCSAGIKYELRASKGRQRI
jgi:hypothetical protein